MDKNGHRDSLDLAYKQLGVRRSSRFEEIVSHAVALVKHSEPPTNLREVAAFAKKLKKEAGEIKKLHRIFLPENEFFFDLPQVLSDYAQHLEHICRTLRKDRKGRPREMAQYLQSLRFLVLKETGREKPAALGKLLTAALVATTANDPEPRTYDFEAALKMNARRYPLPK